MAFGSTINRLRKEAGYSVQKLANLIGIDADRLRKWEQKDFNPRAEDLIRIEGFFGMSLEEIENLKSIKKFLIVPNSENTDSHSGVKSRQVRGENTMHNEPPVKEDYEKLYLSELKDKIRILQDHNSFLARNFELSLSAIHQTTIAQLAHQKALAWYQASNVAKGDPEKTEKEIVKLNNKVAEFAGLKSEKGNPVHS